MTSSNTELNKISLELKNLSLKRHQLEDRRKILCIFQELRSRAEFGQTEEATATREEVELINNILQELNERAAELQRDYDSALNAKNRNSQKDISVSSSQEVQPDVSSQSSSIFYIESPPTFPAPSVILDVKDLPPHPSRTQCPECLQFIVTETFTSISSVTWLACFITALIGCVAGCCFIPFCSDRFKSVTHRCPKCRTSLVTLKKL
ncbi:uncharacterized protein LOC133422108 [Cololabis saira]|uniref:uncharacterized protein LOC133422108 n=1 Tax=Cololabis saira TaxID=129043 RepID=UPI002AD59035|nr:uncharacterized protein LOC133422108 [Cololabis saira]